MRNITILLVDDDRDDTALFEEVLGEVRPSIILQTAENGIEALEGLQNRVTPLPDLIFLDLNMPRMGGKECLLQLKGNTQLRNIPVIIYTTSSQSADIEEAMIAGAVCFITKPNSIKEMKTVLSSIVESLPHNLEKKLRALSNNSNTFIVC